MEGKKVLITGGSRGIGRAIALELAKRGCDVAINYMRNDEAAEETARAIRALGRECLKIRKNIFKVANVRELFARVREAWGRLDFFVSNAALGALAPPLEMPEKGWDLAMNVNAKAFLYGVQEAVRLMPEGGKIVAISSIGAHFVLPGYVAVGASKAALETLVRYLARELAPRGILVNAVSGGPVLTDALRMFPNAEQIIRFAEEQTPLGRIGRPEDLAKVVAWLLSPDADWVVGQVIVADGGLSLGGL